MSTYGHGAQMKECAMNPHARDLHSSRAKGTRRFFFLPCIVIVDWLHVFLRPCSLYEMFQ